MSGYHWTRDIVLLALVGFHWGWWCAAGIGAAWFVWHTFELAAIMTWYLARRKAQ